MRPTLALAFALTCSALALAPTAMAQDPATPAPAAVKGKPVVKKDVTEVTVVVSGAGRVTLEQKAGKRKTLIKPVLDVLSDDAGEVLLSVKSNKAGRKLIGKKGEFTVSTTIVYTPADGSTVQKLSQQVKLKGKKKAKAKKKKAKKKQPGIPGLPGYQDLLDALGIPNFGNGAIPRA